MRQRFSLLALIVLLFGVLAGSTSESARSQVFKITDATIQASPIDYSGTCPAEVRLNGKLESDGPVGVVRYQFIYGGIAGSVSQIAVTRRGTFTVEEALHKNASWNETVYLRVLSSNSLTSALESNRITIKGECRTSQPVTPQTTLSLGPASGRFRVTLNGFTCNHPTVDNPLVPDGADDEVFLFSKVFFVRARPDGFGVTLESFLRRRTEVIGDTASVSFPGRVQGGSSRTMGANGGFRAGDSFPASPKDHSTNLQTYSVPQLLWEGELTRRQTAVVIIPMIWEWDSEHTLFQTWETATLDQLSTVAALISNPARDDQDSAKVALGGEIAGQVVINGRRVSMPLDRPIGMRQYSYDYRLRPEVLILTYDEALRLAEQSRRNNGRAFAINYTDAAELGGDYTLYIQVEQL